MQGRFWLSDELPHNGLFAKPAPLFKLGVPSPISRTANRNADADSGSDPDRTTSGPSAIQASKHVSGSMAMAKCKECGGELSKKAAICPHCGLLDPVCLRTDEINRANKASVLSRSPKLAGLLLLSGLLLMILWFSAS